MLKVIARWAQGPCVYSMMLVGALWIWTTIVRLWPVVPICPVVVPRRFVISCSLTRSLVRQWILAISVVVLAVPTYACRSMTPDDRGSCIAGCPQDYPVRPLMLTLCRLCGLWTVAIFESTMLLLMSTEAAICIGLDLLLSAQVRAYLIALVLIACLTEVLV